MTDLEKSKYFMAGIVTVLTTGVIYLLLFVEVPTGTKDVLNVSLGVLLSIVKETYSYIFGSSEGSAKKTAIIEAQTTKENKDEPTITAKEITITPAPVTVPDP